MEERIDTWVDKKMVVSIALGILLAAWLLWFGGFVLRALGIGGHAGMMKGGMHMKMMQHERYDAPQYDTGYGDAAGTFMEGSEIPVDIDTSAM